MNPPDITTRAETLRTGLGPSHHSRPLVIFASAAKWSLFAVNYNCVSDREEDNEGTGNRLLGLHGVDRIFVSVGRRGRPMAPVVCARGDDPSGLSGLLYDYPGPLEGIGRGRNPAAGLAPDQGVGLRGHDLRPDRSVGFTLR